MESLLVVVTLASLVLATGLAVIAWKVIREHQRFNSARVDALVALADGEEPEMWTFDDEPDAAPVTPDLRAAPETPAVAALAAPRPSRRRAAILTLAATLLVAASAIGVAALHRAGIHLWSAVAWASPASGTAVADRPLELRALEYAIDDASDFVVSGLVADPDNGGTVDGVVVVVYLFNAEGVCFATNRAPIRLDRLQAGETSTFEVRVHAAGPVARYRVGFRLPDGRVVAHIDKRRTLADSARSAGPL